MLKKYLLNFLLFSFGLSLVAMQESVSPKDTLSKIKNLIEFGRLNKSSQYFTIEYVPSLFPKDIESLQSDIVYSASFSPKIKMAFDNLKNKITTIRSKLFDRFQTNKAKDYDRGNFRVLKLASDKIDDIEEQLLKQEKSLVANQADLIGKINRLTKFGRLNKTTVLFTIEYVPSILAHDIQLIKEDIISAKSSQPQVLEAVNLLMNKIENIMSELLERRLDNKAKYYDKDSLQALARALKEIKEILNINVIKEQKLKDKEQIKAQGISFNTLINASNNFLVTTKLKNFPTQANLIQNIAGTDKIKQAVIEEQARGVRPLMHVRVKKLLRDFLIYKNKYGTAIERKLYKNMTLEQFFDRLLIKRPLMFMTAADQYLLRNGKKGFGGFDKIGTAQEKAPLVLKEYISYDEMKLAALIGVSVPTFFINDGDRDNAAKPGNPGTFQKQGVYIAGVGARFERTGLMEWQDMIITPEQNTAENGYGAKAKKGTARTEWIALWSKFYGKKFASFDEAKKDKSGRFFYIKSSKMYLDTEIYKKRMRMVIDPFLIDANARGKVENKKVYAHIVGLGLGVWQKDPIQHKLMVGAYADALQELDLPHIADLDFSWFDHKKIGGVGNLGIFKAKAGPVRIHFSKRNPAAKLTGADKDKLLVAMYAWDGNAYPGNEYWDRKLNYSGDPAAACCSTIPQLQNPLINPNVAYKNIL